MYCRQIKYHQYLVKCEIDISLEITLHLHKCLTACSTKILTLRVAPVLSFSADVLYKPFLRCEENVKCTYLATHLSNLFKKCLGNTSKKIRV